MKLDKKVFTRAFTMLSIWGTLSAICSHEQNKKENYLKMNKLYKKHILKLQEASIPITQNACLPEFKANQENIDFQNHQEENKSLSQIDLEALKKTAAAWQYSSNVRGVVSMVGSTLISLGKFSAVKVVGTLATTLVYTEFLLENKHLEKEVHIRRENLKILNQIKKDNVKETSHETENPNTQTAIAVISISSAVCLASVLFRRFYPSVLTQFIHYSIPASLGVSLYSSVLEIKSRNGRLRQILLNLKTENDSSLNRISLQTILDKENNDTINEQEILKQSTQDENTAKIVGDKVKWLTTTRAFLSTTATIRTWFNIFPAVYFRKVGSIILLITFIEAAGEISIINITNNSLKNENKFLHTLFKKLAADKDQNSEFKDNTELENMLSLNNNNKL